MTIITKMPNIDLNPHDWEEVKRILKTHVPEYEVWAFGSRVTWTAKAYSDLDLAIISDQALSLSTIAKLKDDFDESTLAFKVDVVDWATTSESFRQIIENGKILIQTVSAAKKHWSFKKLIDCTIDGNLSYGIVQPGTHVEDGIPIVRVNNINNSLLRLDEVMQVSPEVENKYKRTRLEGGEVLLTLVGSTGQSVVVPKELAGWNIARAVAVIRPKPEIGANWINICLQTKDAQQFLNERANTTVQKTLNLADVREIPILLPPKKIKEKIEAVYLALTNKIDLNRRINQTLEAMAQAIFKSWFVDFDPVKAKIAAKQEGRDPLHAAMSAISGKTDAELDQLPPEQYQQLASTAALFPDEMVDSELGKIPKGWKVRPMPESIEVNPTRQLKKGAVAPYLDMANVPTNSSRAHTVVLREFASGSKFINGDTLLARITPCLENGKTAFVDFLGNDQICWGSTEFIVLRPKGHLPVEFAYFLCRHPDFRAFAIAQMAGTSGRQRVPNDCFANYLLTVPSQEVSVAFGVVAKCLMNLIRSQDEASKSLSTLRDTLLPKLLSGELAVSRE